MNDETDDTTGEGSTADSTPDGRTGDPAVDEASDAPVADGGSGGSATDGPSVRADAETSTAARRTAVACFEAAVTASLPARVIRESVSVEADGTRNRLRVGDERYDLDAYDRVLVLGGGKAAGGVADALEAILGDRLDGGAVVVPAGQLDPAGRSTTDEVGSTIDDGRDADGPRVERHPGDHPVPSERGVAGARRLLELAEGADERTLVLATITGGGSALLPAPVEGVSLDDLRATTDALLASGAAIDEVNAVRKHLSRLKGGGLARAAAPATVVTLALSDVVGDDPSVIASGPTVPDGTTFADALAVLDRYDLDVPDAVRDYLERGARGDSDAPETARADDPVFERVRLHVLAGGATALRAARGIAVSRGYDALVLSSRVRGEARETALTHAAVAEETLATGQPVSPPAVVLSGGECTVTVRGDGEGGPNQEFALAAALGFDARSVARAGDDDGTETGIGRGSDGDDGVDALRRRVAVLAADSDGRDGATDVAGALVDPGSVVGPDERAAARDALERNDAYGYLSAAGDLVRTGETGTNVNDVRVVVVEGTGSGDGSAAAGEPEGPSVEHDG